MKHRATPGFWHCYNILHPDLQRLADGCYALPKNDVRHPSLHLKKVGKFWSVRVGLHYRALAVADGSDLIWFWIGHHSAYDRLIAGR